MNKYLKVYICCILLFCLVFITGSVAQTFTGIELLARPTNHSITLNVVSSSALDSYIEYGTSSGVYTNTTSTVSQIANEPLVIVIDGLSVNTKYYYRLMYRITGGGSYSARSEHTFTTQRPAGSTFTFDVTSDSHVNIMLGNAATWQQTLTNVANDHPDFLLDLGDTFAMDNVSSESTARANYLFQRTSTTLGLVSPSVPIFIATGNHENQEGWHLNDNSNPFNTEPVWGTNAQKRYFPNPVPNDFYTGDTDTYSGINGDQLHEDYYAWTWGNALFVVIDPFWYTTAKPFIGNTGGGEPGSSDGDRWHWTLGQTQYNWLKQTLENSNATYKFLFMHHMTGGTDDYIRGGAYAVPYCEWGGYNEDGTTYAFNTRRSGWYAPIEQVLMENGVTAVFHGHDHQYAYEIRDGIVYQSLPAAGFSGSGFGIYSQTNPLTYKVLNSPGHLRVTVTPSQTTVDYINSTAANGSNGSVAYSYTINDPLPVELISFTAVLQGTSALLNWSTATETNNSGFQIERSVDGSGVWAEVTFVKGAGTSSSPKTYSYEDQNLAPGVYIYRIKQIDNDGTATIYNPKQQPKVDAGASNIFQLGGNYPNPFNPTTNLQFSVPQDGYASLKVYNMLGQEVATLFSGIAKAGHFIPATFDASRLASGIYFARLQYSGKSLVQRMLMTK
jgi:hypothetical protein